MAYGGVLWNKGRRTLSVRHTCRIPREMRAGFSESQHALTLFGKIPKACQNTLKGDTPYSPLPIFSSLHLSHSTALRDTQLSSADANCMWCWCSSTLYATEAKQNMSLVVFHLVTVLTVFWKKMLQPDTLNFHKWITELTVKDNNSSRHHSILQIYFYGGKQSLTCFWAALKPLTTLFRCASSKNLKNDA